MSNSAVTSGSILDWLQSAFSRKTRKTSKVVFVLLDGTSTESIRVELDTYESKEDILSQAETKWTDQIPHKYWDPVLNSGKPGQAIEDACKQLSTVLDGLPSTVSWGEMSVGFYVSISSLGTSFSPRFLLVTQEKIIGTGFNDLERWKESDEGKKLLEERGGCQVM